MPKGFPIGFDMAEKNVNKHTNKQTNKQIDIFVFIQVEITNVTRFLKKIYIRSINNDILAEIWDVFDDL